MPLEALIVAACLSVVGGSDEEEQSEILAVLERAKEKRSHAEQMATEFMDSIEFFQRRDDSAGFQKEDESRIYHFIMDCQKNIDSIKNSLVEIEGLHDDNKLRDVPETELSALTNQKQDLENVVLMQEMMSLKVRLRRKRRHFPCIAEVIAFSRASRSFVSCRK